jgi:hypothetical protein
MHMNSSRIDPTFPAASSLSSASASAASSSACAQTAARQTGMEHTGRAPLRTTRSMPDKELRASKPAHRILTGTG